MRKIQTVTKLDRLRKMSPQQVKRSKRRNDEYRQRRGANKVGNARNRVVKKELQFLTYLNKLFKRSRIVIEIVFNHTKRSAYVIEHYVVRSGRPIPKRIMTKSLDFAAVVHLIDKCKPAFTHAGLGGFNHLPRARQDEKEMPYLVDYVIGYVPVVENNDAAFPESVPGAYFTYLEEKWKRCPDKKVQLTHTRVIIAKNFLWFEAILHKSEKRWKRYYKALPHATQNRRLPDFKKVATKETKSVIVHD